MTTTQRLSARDRGRLGELERELGYLHSPAHGAAIMRQFAELVETDSVGRWGFEATAAQVRLKDLVVVGPRAPSMTYFRELAKGVESGELGFLYTPTAPEPAQRNRPVLVPGTRFALQLKRDEAVRYGLSQPALAKLLPGLERVIGLADRFDIADHYQLRTLICDGPHLLCYLAAFDAHRPSLRQRHLFEHATELFRRRLLLDQRLATATLVRATLDAALESLGRATFLLSSAGAVVHANALGQDALDRDRSLRTALVGATLGASHGFDVVRLAVPGTPTHFLAMRRVTDLAELSRSLALEFGLGPRATQVLGLAVAGDSTKSTATKLDLAENTVEYHLTRIYQRLGVDGRAELQAMLLRRSIARPGHAAAGAALVQALEPD